MILDVIDDLNFFFGLDDNKIETMDVVVKSADPAPILQIGNSDKGTSSEVYGSVEV